MISNESKAAVTLDSRVTNSFSRVKIKKSSVKIPRLKFRKPNTSKRQAETKIPASVIVNILIRAALEKAKIDKEKKPADEFKKYRIINEENETPGGYGAAPKHYGTSPSTPYVDYGKLFGYLGKFRAQGAYQSDDNFMGFLNNSLEGRSFELVSREAMDKGARFVKYSFQHGADFYENLTSLVPVAGINSADWEKFKLMMQIDKVMYKLKVSIA